MLPSTMGEVVRPPCVVIAPYSSGSERFHTTLPSGDSARSSAETVNMKMLPLAVSTAGEAHAARCCGTSLRNWLTLCSQRTLPDVASTATRRSCVSETSPDVVVCKYRRLPWMTGVDRPPNGSVHARFSPEGDHREGRFFSDDVPSREGPRDSFQSLARSTGARPAANRITRSLL